MWSKNRIRIFLILLLIASGLAFVKLGLTWYDGIIEYQSVQNNQTRPYTAHIEYDMKYSLSGLTITQVNVTSQNGIVINIVNKTISNATVVLPVSLKFRSPEVFSVDNPVNYDIRTAIPFQNIKEFDIVLDSSHNNFYQYKNDTAQLKSIAESAGELIKLHRGNYPFFEKLNGNWTDPIEDQMSIFITMTDGNHTMVSEKSPVLFTISPHLSKLQADTDLNLQRRDLESIQSDTTVEVLTWLIIALIPIGFIIETVIHGFMLNVRNSNKNSSDRKTSFDRKASRKQIMERYQNFFKQPIH